MILRNRQFIFLFVVQFLGALNDNFIKNALVILIAFKGVEILGMQPNALVAFAAAIFILPYFLFSPIAGQISDKYEKSWLIRLVKLWEVLIMIIGAYGFYTNDFVLLLVVLFFMGTQSTFFGPIKYSIIPQIVKPDQLVAGNAYIGMGTFLAILLGTIFGGLAVAIDNYEPIVSGGIISLALLGFLAAYGLGKVRIGEPNLTIRLNPLPSFRSMWSLVREKKAVFNSVLGISWFWFFGSGVLTVLPVYCSDYLLVNEQVVTALLAMFTLGIGIGSILCERLSRGYIEIGLVPIGALGMTLFLADIFFITPEWATHIGFAEFFASFLGKRLLFDFMMTATFGGFFIVPLNALVQERSHSESRSRVIAANNVLNAIFMVGSSILIMVFYAFNLNAPQIYLVFAILNAGIALYIYFIVPEFTLRFWSWIVANLFYRLKVTGEENIPEKGALILACNHVSFADWLVIMAGIKRPVRFIMHYKFFGVPLVRSLMRQAGVIPVAGKNEDPEIRESAFSQISSELKNEAVLCIFPEGQLTTDGNLMPFKPGILRVLGKDPVPVIPMALNNLWDSPFSRKDGRVFLRPPRRPWQTIELKIGPAIPPEEFSNERLEAEIRKLWTPPSST